MARSGVDETSESGAFVRTASTFRSFVSQDPASLFPPESGRYHLYISYACPWACRCLSFLMLKGLDEAITFSVSASSSSYGSYPLLFLYWIVYLKPKSIVFFFLLSRVTQFGEELKKLMTIEDGFSQIQTLSSLELSLIILMVPRLWETSMRLLVPTMWESTLFL